MLDHPFAYTLETAYGVVILLLDLVHLAMLYVIS